MADQTVEANFHRLRKIADGSINPDELTKLLDLAERYLSDLPNQEKETWQQTVAQTLARMGRNDLARQWYKRLAGTSGNPTIVIAAGDFEADQHNWTAAANWYTRANKLDIFNVSASFLRGWALVQSGKADDGQKFVDAADRMAPARCQPAMSCWM